MSRLLARAFAYATLVSALAAAPASAAVPVNDAVRDAIILGGSGGTVDGTNVEASAENIMGTMGPEPDLVWVGGEPEAWYLDSHTVWYRWTAPSTGAVNFRLHTDVAFDRPDLKAYTGTVDYGHLTPNGYGGFAPDFDLHQAGSGAPQWAHPQDVAFTATADTVYYLQVRGGESQCGTFSIDYPAGQGHAPVRLTYSAGAHGTITSGTPTQIVNYGADATTVTASPDVGYHFLKWDDETTCNPRIDTSVTADATFTALFAANTYTAATATRVTGRSSVKVRKRYRLSGTVTPAGPGRATIRITRLFHKKYRHVRTIRVSVTNGRFSCSFRPNHRGKWRLTASYSGGVSGVTTYTGSKSRTKSLRVK